MKTGLNRHLLAAAVATALLAGGAGPALGQDSEAGLASVLERLERLERQQEEQRAQLAERDREIASLKAQLEALRSPEAAPETALAASTAPVARDVSPAAPAPTRDNTLPSHFGQLQPGGKGFKVADTPYGDLNISLYTYARYLNQEGLSSTYTDAFGREFDLDLRNDFQLQKAVVYFKGWVGDPRLRYLTYVWSANTSQGQSAQVVVAGNLSWLFSDSFLLGAGITSLPSTRSTEGNFPRWLRVDNRTIADEYFRASYTTGLFVQGLLGDDLLYRATWGNNLSQLGVDAGQLDDTPDTVSGQLVWTPMGEYPNGFGDYEQVDSLRTRLGLHYTHSTEDRQNQPGLDDPENSQIRISDGTRIFQPGAFNTDGRINEARYQMVAVDWGVKSDGLSLEGEFYWRQVDRFKTEGFIPVNKLEDWGYQLQASAMLVPASWQVYLSGSQIFGEYGDPWDLALGVNWFPLDNRQFRINAEALFIKDSPVGYYSVPYIVGADGTIFYMSTELVF